MISIRSDSWCTWYNFTQFHSNFSLSSLVVIQSQFLQNLSCIFWCVLHSIHSWTLFTCCIIQKGMIKDTSQIEIVEKFSVLSHLSWIVLCHKFKCIYKLTSVHYLHFSLNLTDDVLEFVVNQQCTITILCILKNLICNWSS